MVATGMESEAAKHSGQVLFASNAGVVTDISGFNDDKGEAKYRIVITRDDGNRDEYELMKFVRTNQESRDMHQPTSLGE